MEMKIYADNAATTAVLPEVFEVMKPYFGEQYGNPSSIYRLGMNSLRAVEESRAICAAAIGAKTNEIYFTSGGSEADNWAIKETARRLFREAGKNHIITTNFEHHAVLHTCEALEREGFTVTYLPVDTDGFIKAADAAAAITDKTAIVSIMYANNEIGTILPIAEIGVVCKERGVIFHTDAVQALGNVPIDVAADNITMLSVSGHKIHTPKGIGFLYCKNGTPLPNFIHGGGQERGKRAGTENVPYIAAMAKAISIAVSGIPEKAAKVAKMRDRLIAEITKIPGSRLNGGLTNRLPGNVNISFIGIEGESLLLNLDLMGISVSSGSACTSGSLDPSHVLLALGLPHEVAHGSCRLSINEYNTDEEIDYIIEKIPLVCKKIRDMSPLWEDLLTKPAENEHILKFVSKIGS
ncbi:MAG: cysteine desulfurase NifS [Ruminococcus sp.]|jgi:cysteine desulfurase|nr:cysteine desulfurase NifS [Ruminococcus sp.]